MEWTSFFSGTRSNSERVGILINPNYPAKVIQVNNISDHRLLALKIEINDYHLNLINTYGPKKWMMQTF